ncbi:MAG TPA: FAD-dependent oxidoreductase [Terriglobales bacterium]|nr:FAD-dependent oxidoreductase [Terriglobales bacterium]
MKSRRILACLLCVALALGITACSTTSTGTPPPVEPAGYTPGTYEASAQGMNGPVPVSVTVSEDKIESVVVGDNRETKGLGTYSIDLIPQRIVEEQSLAVDNVTGATITAGAILRAVETALTEAGADIASLKVPKEPPALTQGETETFDVVIVGAGLAGIHAAYELLATSPETTYVVLEKRDIVTGSLPPSGGAIAGTTSNLHAAANAECTVDDLIAMLQKGVDEGQPATINRELVTNVYAKSATILNRMQDWGFPFYTTPRLSSVYTTKVNYFSPTTATGEASNGQDFAAFFVSHVAANPFNLRLGNKVTDLVVTDGAVTGVKVLDVKANKEYQIDAKAVLLVTGGFAANPELVAKYNPEYLSAIMRSHSGATGDGYVMTEQFGTKVLGTGVMGTPRVDINTNPLTSRFYATVDGGRIYNENAPNYAMVRAMAAYGKDVFALLDSKFENKELLAQHMEKGFAREYDSLEALAEGEGINKETLLATVDAYNKAVDEGKSPGYDLPADKAVKLDTAPYYAEKLYMTYFGVIPGIEVDGETRVLDGNGTPVPNLYAAGELTFGNITNNRYPGTGIGISYASFSGPLAINTIIADLSK